MQNFSGTEQAVEQELNSMNRLQTLLATNKSTDDLICWGIAFHVTDGRGFYSTPIYALIYEALERLSFTGRVLVFARDADRVGGHPVYLVQMVPVLGESDTSVQGSTFAQFIEFRNLITELVREDSGMTFLSDLAEIGPAIDPALNSILRGDVELEAGQVVRMTRANPYEVTLFEDECMAKWPGIETIGAHEEAE